eukprot:INCI13419.1.p1 GENE.INCI13419.1~~INCI13419.1.p1  ORF type:complete len:1236 (+),score=245.68 INCI13419.1:428-3709(+)
MAQQTALGGLLAQQHELEQHLNFSERQLEQLKDFPSQFVDAAEASLSVAQTWYSQYVLDPVVQRVDFLRKKLETTKNSLKNGVANLMRLRAEAQLECAERYAGGFRSIEDAFETQVMTQLFTLKASFAHKELVCVEDPRDVEEAQLQAERKALVKGGATSKVRSPRGGIRSSYKESQGENASLNESESSSSPAHGNCIPSRLHEDPTAHVPACAGPVQLSRSRNTIDAAAVLRHLRDSVDQLARLADEARPVGVDDNVGLIQPKDSFEDDTRALHFAIRMCRLAQQARLPAVSFAEQLVESALGDGGPAWIQDQQIAATPPSSLPLGHQDRTSTGEGGATTNAASRPRITAELPLIEHILSAAYETFDGDFARVTQYVQVTIEVDSLAQLDALLRTILSRTKKMVSHTRNADEGSNVAAIADVLSFCLAPTSTGQMLHVARGGSAWPCRQRLGSAASSGTPSIDGANCDGDVPLRPRHALFRVNRPGLHRDGNENFGIRLAARLLSALSGQRHRVGKARGVGVGANGFIFELHLTLSALSRASTSVSSSIHHAPGLTDIERLRLYDQCTLYPLLDANDSDVDVAVSLLHHVMPSSGHSSSGRSGERKQDDDDWASYGLLNPAVLEEAAGADKGAPPPKAVSVRTGLLQCLAAGIAVQLKMDGVGERMVHKLWPHVCSAISLGYAQPQSPTTIPIQEAEPKFPLPSNDMLGMSGYGMLRTISLAGCGLTFPMLQELCHAFLPLPVHQREAASGETAAPTTTVTDEQHQTSRGGCVAFLDISQNAKLTSTRDVLETVGAAFPNLRKLCIDRCSLSVALAEEGRASDEPGVERAGLMQSLARLRRGLTLAYNKIPGRLPSALCTQLQGLTQLWLNDNQFTGSIPTQIGELSSLQVLMLQNNRLSGPLPSDLGRLLQLSELNIETNALTGTLPTELGQLQQLRLLNLRGNRLSGGFPDELCGMAELQHLVLADNRLQGRIPPGIFLLPKLWQLWLNGNRLSGALPEAARDSFNLNMLILEDNALTGRIPLSWTEFSNLSVLRVGGNRGLKPHREVELVLGKKWKTFDNAAQVTKFMRALKKQRRKAEDAAKSRYALK